jgi:hypothetical protein
MQYNQGIGCANSHLSIPRIGVLRMPCDSNVARCVCGDDQCAIPFGLCHCGCGEKTEISPQTVTRDGWIKGVPRRFVFNHHGRKRIVPEDAPPFKIEGVYCRLIPLTRGQHAIVDAADYEHLMRWKWHAQWCPATNSFYAYRNLSLGNRRQHRIGMHREILGLMPGDGIIGEHENCVTLDCRRKNLRVATHAQNMQNMRLVRRNTSGFKGVYRCEDGRHWWAGFTFNGTMIRVGRFSSSEAADKAVREVRERVCGKFARNK